MHNKKDRSLVSKKSMNIDEKLKEIKEIYGITIDAYSEYNENEKIIHYKDLEGIDTYWDYDESGNMIHCKNSNGFESWHEYDENGNEIYCKYSNGYERCSKYDENGNWISSKGTWQNSILNRKEK